MMIEDEKPLEESPETANPVENATDAGPSDGPTLDEVDLDLEEDSATEAAAASAEAQPSPSGAAAELQQEVDRLRSQLDERMGQYVRITADFENFRKRTQKERQDLEVQVKCSTISELLPVIDNSERARSQIKPQTDGEMTIHKSYQGVYKQLVDALKKLGVSPMRAEGEPFDPNLHEAVMREATSEYDDGVVMEQLMRGYMVGERVLRHAMVKVAMASDEADPEEGSAPE